MLPSLLHQPSSFDFPLQLENTCKCTNRFKNRSIFLLLSPFVYFSILHSYLNIISSNLFFDFLPLQLENTCNCTNRFKNRSIFLLLSPFVYFSILHSYLNIISSNLFFDFLPFHFRSSYFIYRYYGVEICW